MQLPPPPLCMSVKVISVNQRTPGTCSLVIVCLSVNMDVITVGVRMDHCIQRRSKAVSKESPKG